MIQSARREQLMQSFMFFTLSEVDGNVNLLILSLLVSCSGLLFLYDPTLSEALRVMNLFQELVDS